MKLQQLRFIHEVAAHRLNISAAAESLFASQPGMSKQIRALEDELGVRIFERSGKHLTGITAVGRQIMEHSEQILDRAKNIRRIAQEWRNDTSGELTVATTHTQARYRLPPVVRRLMKRYPGIALHLHQGTPMQIARMASEGKVDFAIATEAIELFSNLTMMPCYRWNRSIVVPPAHPLGQAGSLTLKDVSRYPIVTYVFGFTGRSQLDKAFSEANLEPNLVFTATDADVIKTYVRLGLGIGIIASMAYDPVLDGDLRALDASHLFEDSTTWIGFRQGTFLRTYMYDFVALFAPHLTRQFVQQAMEAKSRKDLQKMLRDCELPILSTPASFEAEG